MKIIPKIIYEKRIRKWIIWLCVISAIIQVVESRALKKPMTIGLANITEDFHMNLLTVNSIFCGFELTNLGILVSLASDNAIQKLRGTQVLQRRNRLVLLSVSFCTLSMVTALFFILNIDKTCFCFKYGSFVVNYIFKVEIFSLILGIAFFIGTVKKMIDMIYFNIVGYLFLEKRWLRLSLLYCT